MMKEATKPAANNQINEIKLPSLLLPSSSSSSSSSEDETIESAVILFIHSNLLVSKSLNRIDTKSEAVRDPSIAAYIMVEEKLSLVLSSKQEISESLNFIYLAEHMQECFVRFLKAFSNIETSYIIVDINSQKFQNLHPIYCNC